MKRIGVLLSGCGVFDGSEIQESVSVLIALDELGLEAVCIAPDIEQMHVINHLKGEEMEPPRNVLVEAARIARGNITSLAEVDANSLDGLILAGGFGAAKNLCSWAVDGPEATIIPEAADLVRAVVAAGKPLAALCVAPVVIAKALQDGGPSVTLTLGSTEGASPYDIAGFHEGVSSTGMKTKECAAGEIVVDEDHKIITTPCYMMETSPARVLAETRKACTTLADMLDSSQGD